MIERAVYIFEVKGIQPFLFAGGRLRDAVGASALVDAVAGDRGAGRWTSSLLDGLLKEDARLAGARRTRVLRRAAGAFRVAFFGAGAVERAQHFQKLTRLLVATLLPGVDWIDGVGRGDTLASAAKAAHAGLDGRRGLNAVPGPAASPIFERAPRFGTAASCRIRPKEGEELEPADDGLRAKQAAANTAGLLRRLAKDVDIRDWPFDFEGLFEEYDGPRSVGVIQADGNRLGAVVRAFSKTLGEVHPGGADELSPSEEKYAADMLAFSAGIENATRTAASRALELTILSRREKDALIPARPLIQAGDDLLVVARADLAVDFADTFLLAFREEAKHFVARVFSRASSASSEAGEEQAAPALPALSACAGVALVGASQPFIDAHALAESLCKFAKRAAKQGLGPDDEVPSALAFHRVTSSIVPDYDDALERDLTVDGRRLTLGPYVVTDDGAPELPRLADLYSLYALCSEEGFARGPLRQLAGLLYEGEGLLAQRFGRFADVLERTRPDRAKAFRKALAPLTGPTAGLFDRNNCSPLADLLALVATKSFVPTLPELAAEAAEHA